MKEIVHRFLHEERGASSIEYAILVSLIAAVIAFSVSQLGLAVRSMYESFIKIPVEYRPALLGG